MITAKIKNYLRNDPEFRFTEEVTEATPLLESGVFDSMSIIKMVSFLEGAFEIRIEEADLFEDNFETLKHMEAFVLRKQEQAKSG